MDGSVPPLDQNIDNQASFDYLHSKVFLGFVWLISLLIAGYLGFAYGKDYMSVQPSNDKKVLMASTNQISPIIIASPAPQIKSAVEGNDLPSSDSNNIPSAVSTITCARSGFAQKWEYLTAYTIKAGDTIQSIASDQLNDASRVNEILQINGVGPLVIGSTLYLPPPMITKSSGNIKEVYGKLVDKAASYWHISFSANSSGLGVLIPSYWFVGMANIDSYQVGDCLKVLYDDGDKVYTISLQ
jgi:LysM repeat protein